MNTEQMLALVMARRTAKGLVLHFKTPDHPIAPYFTCSPKDDEQKAKWLQQAAARGWELMS